MQALQLGNMMAGEQLQQLLGSEYDPRFRGIAVGGQINQRADRGTAGTVG